MRPSALKKIKAYDIRKDGSKAILEILDEPQGYSRKYEILQKIALKRLRSDIKVQNGLDELLEIGFIEIFTASSGDKRIRIRKTIWDRDPRVIGLEHSLIKEKFNTSARWINPRNVIRDVRTMIQKDLQKKPSHQAVECHLKLFLSQNKHAVNESGLIRLARFDQNQNLLKSNNRTPSTIFDSVESTKSAPLEDQNRDKDEFKEDIYDTDMDFSFASDLFTTGGDDEEFISDNDPNDAGVHGIDIDIFGGPFSSDNTSAELADKKLNIINKIERSDYLAGISAYFSSNQYINIKAGFNELDIEIDKIRLNILYNPSPIEIIVSYEREVDNTIALDALRLYSKTDMLAQLSLNSLGGKERLLARLKIPILKYDSSELNGMIEKMIHEAITIGKLR